MAGRPKDEKRLEARVDILNQLIKRLEAEQKELKKVEGDLRGSLEQYDQVLSRSPAIICHLDSTGKTLFVNQAVQAVTGYAPKELLGRNWWKTFYPGKLYRQIEDLSRQFGKKQDVVQAKFTLRTKNGKLRDIFWTSHNLWDKKGRLVEIAGVGQAAPGPEALAPAGISASEFKKIQGPLSVLMKTYDSFMKMQDAMTFLTCVIDPKANVLSWNRAAETITGYSRQEVLGNNKIWGLLYPDPEYRKAVFLAGFEFMFKPGLENIESVITAKDGSRKSILWHYNVLPGPAGHARGFFMIGSDMTATREREDQARLAQKMESLARLSGHIAHGFNNSFSIIQGYVELALERMGYNDPGREDLLEIVDEVERGSALTNQLLAFSKAQILEPISLDLNKLVRSMTKTLTRTLGEKIELVTELAPRLPTIKADPNQIQQVILNLAANARDFMPRGGKFILATDLAKIEYPHVQAKPLVEPGEYITISVSDTGIGISPEHRERIFEPFFSTKPGKIGFGLSTVYGIVKQHNGYIWIFSEPEKGTTFRIYLGKSGRPAQLPVPKKLALEMPKGSESILLVEDSDQMRALAVRILRNLGYTVIETSNPKEALQILQQYPDPIQLLLTDVEMPLMNGSELAAKAVKLKPDLKVLYFSGYSIAYLVDNNMLKPGSPLLVKPFSLRSISQKVREILDQ